MVDTIENTLHSGDGMACTQHCYKVAQNGCHLGKEKNFGPEFIIKRVKFYKFCIYVAFVFGNNRSSCIIVRSFRLIKLAYVA